MAERPLPSIDDDNKRYYFPEQGVLEIQRCAECGLWNFYPRTHCRKCLSDNLQWQSAEPTGTIYSYTIIHRPQHEFFVEGIPHIVVVVDMDDGFQIIASLQQGVEDTVEIGDRVIVSRQSIAAADSISIPVFRYLGNLALESSR